MELGILCRPAALQQPRTSKQASKFIRQKQYYDNINTKYKQYSGRLPEGNPSIELVAYSKIYCYNINSEEKEAWEQT